MDDLISALQILRKYGNPRHPFVCEHDMPSEGGGIFDTVIVSETAVLPKHYGNRDASQFVLVHETLCGCADPPEEP